MSFPVHLIPHAIHAAVETVKSIHEDIESSRAERAERRRQATQPANTWQPEAPKFEPFMQAGARHDSKTPVPVRCGRCGGAIIQRFGNGKALCLHCGAEGIIGR